jgi:uridine phosphorylase
LRERFFGSAGAGGRQNMYAAQDHHFASAPLPPVPPYGLQSGVSGAAGHEDMYERRMVQDDFYGDARPYVTAAAADASGYRDVFERETVQDEFYGNGRPYVTAAAADTSGYRDVVERETVQDEFYGNDRPYVTAAAASTGAHRDIFERQTVQDDFYDGKRPYVAVNVEDTGVRANRAMDNGSESYSEEEITTGGMRQARNEARLADTE